MRATVTTRTGTVYEVDTAARTVTWADRKYEDVYIIHLSEGAPLVYEGVSVGRAQRTVRRTTPVRSIEVHA